MEPKLKGEADMVRVKVDPNKFYKVELRADQLQLILKLVQNSPFKGEDAFLVANTISAIQKPLLDDAHGADEDE